MDFFVDLQPLDNVDNKIIRRTYIFAFNLNIIDQNTFSQIEENIQIEVIHHNSAQWTSHNF